MGWFLVNIVAPFLLPVIGILPLRLVPLPAPTGSLRLMATVKDGQLCWAVIAMSASTIYELWAATSAQKVVPAWSGFLLFGDFCLLLPAMIVAALGAAFSTPLLTRPAGGMAAWIKYYKAFVGSAIMSALAGVAYTALHFSL